MSEKKSDDLGKSRIIFDSRKANQIYTDGFQALRSESFVIGGGQVGMVELIGRVDVMKAVVFTAVMVVPGIRGGSCFDTSCIGKRFRSGECGCDAGRDLGNDETGGAGGGTITPYNKSIMRWGKDVMNDGKIYEFGLIDRPGSYYLVGEKCNNAILEECENPLLIQLTIYRP